MDESVYFQAVSILTGGGVVAFPTETYYGLAVDPFNEEALQKLFHVKQREPNKPILVLIHEASQLNSLVRYIPEHYKPLMEKFWPGPLTLIFPAHTSLSSLITCGLGTIGVRISSHHIAQTFCEIWDNPLTATSANISGSPPLGSAVAVKKDLGNVVDFVIDGGKSPGGDCSTIVGLQGDKLCLIRPGLIAFSDILIT